MRKRKKSMLLITPQHQLQLRSRATSFSKEDLRVDLLLVEDNSADTQLFLGSTQKEKASCQVTVLTHYSVSKPLRHAQGRWPSVLLPT